MVESSPSLQLVHARLQVRDLRGEEAVLLVQQLVLPLQKDHRGPYRRSEDLARGLFPDLRAIRAALELPWSNGPTEGHINRLKTLKRQMYGAAGFAGGLDTKRR